MFIFKVKQKVRVIKDGEICLLRKVFMPFMASLHHEGGQVDSSDRYLAENKVESFGPPSRKSTQRGDLKSPRKSSLEAIQLSI